MKCDVGRCNRSSIVQYAAFEHNSGLAVEVCDRHWEKHCDDNERFDLRKHFSAARVAKKVK
jgi:hypothetical protein